MEVHLKQKRSEKPLLRKNIIEKTAYLCTTDRLSFFLIIMNKILMQAKEDAKETIRVMRYRDDQSGYFWIDDTDYTLVMHPILSEQEGDNRYELEDQNGIMIIQEIMKVCQSAEKGGYNEFYFTKADGVTVAPLKKIQSFAERMSEGNLTTSVEVRQKNEIGQTADALKIAQDNMRALLQGITE